MTPGRKDSALDPGRGSFPLSRRLRERAAAEKTGDTPQVPATVEKTARPIQPNGQALGEPANRPPITATKKPVAKPATKPATKTVTKRPPRAAAKPAAKPLKTTKPAPVAKAAPVKKPKIKIAALDLKAQVVLRATADTWIQVRDRRSGVLVSMILKTGGSYEFQAKNGMTLNLGNAGTIQMAVNGRDLRPLGSSGMPRRNLSLDPENLAKLP